MEQTKTVTKGSDKRQPKEMSNRSSPRDFNQAWLGCIRAAREGQRATEKRYGDACYAYASAIQQLWQQLQNRSAEAYQSYAKAAQQASGSENPQNSHREAYRLYVETWQETQQAAEQFGEEAYKTYAIALVAAQEERKDILRNGLRQYLQSLKETWAKLDVDSAIEPEAK